MAKKKSAEEIEARLKKVNEERRKLNRELKEYREKELLEKRELSYKIVCQILKVDSLIGIDRSEIISRVNAVLRTRTEQQHADDKI